MIDAKTLVETLLQTLPDDCSLAEIRYQLTVMARIKCGLADARADEVQADLEAQHHLKQWLHS